MARGARVTPAGSGMKGISMSARKRLAAPTLSLEPAPGALGWRPRETHPLAALFPMLAPDDLAALADDIKSNGLRTPLVIDAAGVLIDGRNRLAACEIAGVEPSFASLDGQDPEAFIWSSNAKRRQMTKGQIAMVAAMGSSLFLASKRGGADTGKAAAAKAAGISPARLTQALTIKQHALDLAQPVIVGTLMFGVAYEQAKAREKEAKWRDDGLQMLRDAAPDLAVRVTEGEIDIQQGRKLLTDRERAEEATRNSVLMGLKSMTAAAGSFDKSESLRLVPVWIKTEDGEKHFLRYFDGGLDEVRTQIEAAKRGLAAVEQVFRGMR